MRLAQIDHLAIGFNDPKAASAWFVRVLGFQSAYKDVWGDVPLFLRLGTTFLALFPKNKSAGTTSSGESQSGLFRHLALNASTYGEFEQAQRELTEQGIAWRFEDHQIAHSIYFSGPEGIPLEVTTYELKNKV